MHFCYSKWIYIKLNVIETNKLLKIALSGHKGIYAFGFTRKARKYRLMPCYMLFYLEDISFCNSNFFCHLKPNNSNNKPEYLSIVLDTGDGPIEEQCERLQYDPNQWEFPQERLKLGTFLNFVFLKRFPKCVLGRFNRNCSGFGDWDAKDGREQKVFKIATDMRIFS